MAEAPSYRLPRTVVPERYELTLTPDLDEASFSGESRIQVEVTEAVTEIVLNAIELDIHTAELSDETGNRLEGTIALDEAEQRAVITLDNTATPGTWNLHLTFTGILNDKLHGFYRSTFKDADGAERTIATTQFEATDARRAFPCWDEPDFKATFAVTLIVDEALTAISNGAPTSEQPLGNGKKQVIFAETIPMSTYLVAFVVGPFELTDPHDVGGVPLRIASTPGKQRLTRFAIDAGAAALTLPRQVLRDPLPERQARPRRHPGLRVRRHGEPGLRHLPGDGPARRRPERVAPRAATGRRGHRPRDGAHVVRRSGDHEVVERDLAERGLRHLHGAPGGRRLQAGVGRLGLLRRREERSHADRRPEEHQAGRVSASGGPEEAEGMFDVLTYQKGGAVLRMLEQYLGAETFRKGIVRYLNEHRFANTETTDLWDAIEAESGEPARAVMDSWIDQGGYPLVSVIGRGVRADTQPATFPLRRRRRRRTLAGAHQPALLGRRPRLRARGSCSPTNR